LDGYDREMTSALRGKVDGRLVHLETEESVSQFIKKVVDEGE